MKLNYADIKKYVLKHDRIKVAEKHKVSLSTVYMVGSGRRRNIPVLESLIEIAENNKKKFIELETRTKNL